MASSIQAYQTHDDQRVRACSIWRAIDVLGDKPTLLILEAYWLGERRFSSFVESTGLLHTVVNDRLKKLVASGCMEKKAYRSQPIRYEYVGLPKLHSIYPVALSMLYWERQWSHKKSKLDPILSCRHCGQVTRPKPVCNQCGEAPISSEVRWLNGPGSGAAVEQYQRRRRCRSHRGVPDRTRMFDTVAGIIGDRSAVLILRALFTNQTSFIEIQTDTQLASNILSERLKWLIDLAIVCKRDTAHEARQSYELTQKGDDLYPILLTLMAWGDEWYSSETGPPVHLQHQICGQLMKTALVCSECHQETGYRDITFSLGHEN